MATAYYNMLEAVTFRHSDRIRKYTRLLSEGFSVKEFFYFKVENDGRFGFIGAFPEWNQHFASNKFYLNLPFYRHPKHFKSCILPLQQVEDPGFSEISRHAKEKFNTNICFAWIDKIDNGYEGFGISSNIADVNQSGMLLNDLAVFKLFAKKYKEDNRVLFEKLEENKANIKDLIGDVFYHKSIFYSPGQSRKNTVLKMLGIEAPLSSAESQVMKFLINGYSASRIAAEIYRSSRTIEHRIERMKDKLSCRSKTELIQKGIELEKLGYLNEGVFLGKKR